MSYKFYSSNYQNDNYNDNVTTTSRNHGDGFYSPDPAATVTGHNLIDEHTSKNPAHHKKTIDEYKDEINDLISKISNILTAIDDSVDNSDEEDDCPCGSCLGCTTTVCDDGSISQHFYECDEDDENEDGSEDDYELVNDNAFDDDYAYDECTIPWEDTIEDLFEVPVYYNIVHCIPTDCTLGSVIARRVDDYYDIQRKLCEYYDEIEVGDVVWEDNVFTMFPTTNRYDKLTLKNLILCLKNLANYCYHSQVKFIAMPHIGMGGGGLGKEYNWEFIRNIILSTIEETLMNLDTDYRPYIRFCNYVKD